MIKTAEGIVLSIIHCNEEITKFIASIGNKEYECINYNKITGLIEVGDKVLLNTTAVELQLGTGGFHFVLANLSKFPVDNLGSGHIMKLKYTPMQINCMTVEAQESRYHDIFKELHSLEGMPVIVGSLHSILAPCCIYLKSIMPKVRICYIMTDGGALPLQISDVVRKLRSENLLDGTVTYGNAFGGDYECVNIYTALVTAKKIIHADVVIVCMGPGIVGTGTILGFTGTEQASVADAINKMRGFPVVVPRISFTDQRARHVGISHHSITVLKHLCCTRMNIAVPNLPNREHMKLIDEQILINNLNSLHNIYYVDVVEADDILESKSAYLKKMGKGYIEEKEYFLSCVASAKLCSQKLN